MAEQKPEPTLPIKGMTLLELNGALFINCADEKLEDSYLKLENFICNFAKRRMIPLSESGKFTEEEIDSLMDSVAVISPFTLSLFLADEQMRMEKSAKIPFSKKEATLLEQFPDRYRARYKANLADRHSREITEEESDSESDSDGSIDTDTLIYEEKDFRAFGGIVDELFRNPRSKIVEDFLAERKKA